MTTKGTTPMKGRNACRLLGRTACAGVTALLLGSAATAQEAPPAIATEAPALTAPVAADDAAPALPESDAASALQGEAPIGADTAGETARPTEVAPPATEQQSPPGAARSPSGTAENTRQDALSMLNDLSGPALTFLRDGGPAIWAIAALSVATVALILWKIWHLALMGAWARGKAGRAVTAFERGDATGALGLVQGRCGMRSKVLATTLRSLDRLTEATAREETTRVARRHLAAARDGLGALELIATIAPLLGLLGTVLGMIAAFQALQSAGSRADPALLAGGIWEALLTTAAGMAVAIPASAALTWFESVIERMRRDIEDNTLRVFVAAQPEALRLAAE